MVLYNQELSSSILLLMIQVILLSTEAVICNQDSPHFLVFLLVCILNIDVYLVDFVLHFR